MNKEFLSVYFFNKTIDTFFIYVSILPFLFFIVSFAFLTPFSVFISGILIFLSLIFYMYRSFSMLLKNKNFYLYTKTENGEYIKSNYCLFRNKGFNNLKMIVSDKGFVKQNEYYIKTKLDYVKLKISDNNVVKVINIGNSKLLVFDIERNFNIEDIDKSEFVSLSKSDFILNECDVLECHNKSLKQNPKLEGLDAPLYISDKCDFLLFPLNDLTKNINQEYKAFEKVLINEK